MIKDVLRLKLHGKLSHEAIARSLSVSKGVVAKYASLATTGGLQDWESIAALSEAELERRLFGAGPEQRRVVEPDFGRIHLELRRKGVTLTLLWEEYRAANEGRRTWGLTQFCVSIGIQISPVWGADRILDLLSNNPQAARQPLHATGRVPAGAPASQAANSSPASRALLRGGG